MSDLGVQSAADLAPGLSQWQRVVNIFTAPSKTFEDIKRGHKSWWMPFLISVVAGFFCLPWSIEDRHGHGVGKPDENGPQARRADGGNDTGATCVGEKISVGFTEGIFIANPLLVLAFVAGGSLVLWGTINFAFGGKASYGSVFTAWMFAGLPGVIKVLLGIIVIYAGMAPESFNIRNFAPTNAGAFLNPVDTNKVLYSLATSLDAITIWTLVLMGIGVSMVAGSSGHPATSPFSDGGRSLSS